MQHLILTNATLNNDLRDNSLQGSYFSACLHASRGSFRLETHTKITSQSTCIVLNLDLSKFFVKLALEFLLASRCEKLATP